MLADDDLRAGEERREQDGLLEVAQPLVAMDRAPAGRAVGDPTDDGAAPDNSLRRRARFAYALGALAKCAALNRAALEHVIRASAAISGDDEIVVIGSQSILGQFPAPPLELCVSNEADV